MFSNERYARRVDVEMVFQYLDSNFNSADNCAVLFGNYRMISEVLDLLSYVFDINLDRKHE